MEGRTELNPLEGKSEIRIRALYICDRIDTRALEKTELLAYSPMTMQVSDDGCAVVLRYGAVVLFNVRPAEEVAFLENLAPFLSNPLVAPEKEEIFVHVGQGKSFRVKGDVLSLPSFSVAHLQLIGEILARSVVLDYYEKRVSDNFQAIELKLLLIGFLHRSNPVC